MKFWQIWIFKFSEGPAHPVPNTKCGVGVRVAECKESHFYSLPFGQAEHVATGYSMSQPKSHFNHPAKIKIKISIDYNSSVILIPAKLPLSVEQVKNRIH